jgi:hypothetical protein
MELTPNFAGSLMGMTTMIANTTGFLAPLFTGAVTNNNVIIPKFQSTVKPEQTTTYK